MSRRVLIVEDDTALARRLEEILGKNLACRVERVEKFQLAANLLRENDYDMVVLDRQLADGDGLELLRRGWGGTRRSQYLVLSGWGQTPDRELGLQAGAFDYLAKPFSAVELIEKAKRLLLTNGCLSDEVVNLGPDVVYLPRERRLIVAGREEKLSRLDANLLDCLTRHPVATHELLRRQVWGHKTRVTTNAIAVRVHRLRSRLGQSGRNILSYYDLGYQLKIASPAMTDTSAI